MRVTNDYSGVSREWLIGDVGDITDWSIGVNAMPNEFDPRKARLFLEYMQLGLTERQSCLEVPVSERMINSWKRGANGSPNSFLDAYTEARRQQIHAMAQETIDIADGTDRQTYEYLTNEKEGISNPFKLDGEHPPSIAAALKALSSRASERITARRWLASKVLPLNYGDRMQLEHTGDTKKPVSLNVKGLSTETLEKLAALDEELKSGNGS